MKLKQSQEMIPVFIDFFKQYLISCGSGRNKPTGTKVPARLMVFKTVRSDCRFNSPCPSYMPGGAFL